MRRNWLMLGLALLSVGWTFSTWGMTGHMVAHMIAVAVAAPPIALGFQGTRFDPAVRLPRVATPLAAAMIEAVVVWGWHTPYLHHLSRSEPLLLALEQASFAAVALLVWLVAFSGPPLAGAITLFFTSMHMTLLGALIGLSSRPLFAGHHQHAEAWLGLTPLADQHVGGVVMLAIGGVIYLGGGLILAARALRPPVPS